MDPDQECTTDTRGRHAQTTSACDPHMLQEDPGTVGPLGCVHLAVKQEYWVFALLLWLVQVNGHFSDNAVVFPKPYSSPAYALSVEWGVFCLWYICNFRFRDSSLNKCRPCPGSIGIKVLFKISCLTNVLQPVIFHIHNLQYFEKLTGIRTIWTNTRQVKHCPTQDVLNPHSTSTVQVMSLKSMWLTHSKRGQTPNQGQEACMLCDRLVTAQLRRITRILKDGASHLSWTQTTKDAHSIFELSSPRVGF